MEKFRINPISLKIKQIGFIFCETVAIGTTPLLISLAIWQMITNTPNMNAFATSFAISLTFVQMLLIGVTVLIKNRKISGTLNDIQKTVDERMLRLFFYKSNIRPRPQHLLLIFIYLESKDSMESTKIYERAERLHAVLTHVLFTIDSVIFAVIFVVCLMFPISYALFSYPEPSQWRLLLDIQ